MVYERKIINDPVFGFINIPKGLLYDIVRHPLLQRLTRIKQVGLSSVVYPGAQHTRFQHSLGAFYLMSEAITQLASKGNFIFDSEAEAVQAAILLHDIGHGPFSHVLEDTIVKGIPHEEISLMLMERMNKEMNGQLSLAIQIFKDEYPKRFLHQLVSGQLDMDRLDYLRRDSFYTGVTEGNIGSARILNMLDVDTSNKTLFQAIKELITSPIDLSNIKDSNDVSKINSKIEQTTSNLQAQVDMKMKAFYNEETSERKGFTEQESIISFYNEETSEGTGYTD